MPFILERIKKAANGGLSRQGNTETITGYVAQVIPDGIDTTRYLYSTKPTNSNSPKSDQWVITQKAGRWDIGVGTPAGFSGTFRRAYGYAFKIDKREQIVQFAKKWDGKPQSDGRHGGEICDDIVRYVYRHVGFGEITHAVCDTF